MKPLGPGASPDRPLDQGSATPSALHDGASPRKAGSHVRQARPAALAFFTPLRARLPPLAATASIGTCTAPGRPSPDE